MRKAVTVTIWLLFHVPLLFAQEAITPEEAKTFTDQFIEVLLYEQRADRKERLAVFFDEATRKQILDGGKRLTSYYRAFYPMITDNPVHVWASGNRSNTWNTWLEFRLMKEDGKIVVKGKVEKDWTFPTVQAWERSGSLDEIGFGGEAHYISAAYLERRLRNYLAENFGPLEDIYERQDFTGAWVMDSTRITEAGSSFSAYITFPERLGVYEFLENGQYYFNAAYEFPGLEINMRPGRWFVLGNVLAYLSGNGNRFEYHFIEEKRQDHFTAYTLDDGDTLRCKFVRYTPELFQEPEEKAATAWEVSLDTLGLNILAEPQYESIRPFNERYLLVEQNSKKGLIDHYGQIVLPTAFERLAFIEEERRILARKKNQWYEVDSMGTMHLVSDLELRDTTDNIFEQMGYKIAGRGEKTGLIGNNGDTLIPFIYDALAPVYRFESPTRSDPGAPRAYYPTGDKVIGYGVHLGRKEGLVLKDGTSILEPVYSSLDSHQYPYISASKKGEAGKTGLYHAEWREWLLSFKYDFISVDEQYITAKKEGLDYLFQLDGTPVPLPEADVRHHFRDSLVGIERNGKRGVVNFKGDILVPVEFSQVEWMAGDTFRVQKDGKWGIHSIRDGAVIPTDYEGLYSLTTPIDRDPSNAPLAYESGGLKGILNWQGQRITPPLYREVGGYNRQTGLIEVRQGSQYGLIDRFGDLVLDPEYDFIGIAGDRHYTVELQDRTGLVDAKGESVLPVIFESLAFVPHTQWDFLNNVEGMVAFQWNGKWGLLQLSE